LKSQGFIKEDKTLFQTTDKGRELIEEFESSPLIHSMLLAQGLDGWHAFPFLLQAWIVVC
jgi:hypothetical protein